MRVVPGVAALVAMSLVLMACGAGNGDDSLTPPPGAPAVDLTRLPLGDGRVSTLPEAGAMFSCIDVDPPFLDDPPYWISEDGMTWDATIKPEIEGMVIWDEASSRVVLAGDVRRIVTNALPNHFTGEFPVTSEDPAYEFDPNPNSVEPHPLQFELPRTPQVLVEPRCIMPGQVVGVLLTGALLYAPLDEEGRDAMAHAIFDICDGRPNAAGMYHYTSASTCTEDQWEGDHSRLIGYALDGFPIFGHYDVNGSVVTNPDLDPCHGHTHEVEWDGETRTMYHYHATWEFPYVIGCFRGEPIEFHPPAVE